MSLLNRLKGVRQQGPGWVKEPKAFKASMFNARSESVAEKASFKGPLRRKRTVIPASGFYEWRREGGNAKTPHYLQLAEGEPIGFAGLYDLWNDEVLSCTILTTTPNTLMATIHDRMPVILSPNHYDRWLNPGITDPTEVQDLLKPYAGKMQATRSRVPSTRPGTTRRNSLHKPEHLANRARGLTRVRAHHTRSKEHQKRR